MGLREFLLVQKGASLSLVDLISIENCVGNFHMYFITIEWKLYIKVLQSLVYHVSEKQRNLNTFQMLNFQAAQGLEFHKGTIFQMLLKMEQQDWYPFSNMAHYKESSSTICQKKYEMKAFFKHKNMHLHYLPL